VRLIWSLSREVITSGLHPEKGGAVPSGTNELLYKSRAGARQPSSNTVVVVNKKTRLVVTQSLAGAVPVDHPLQ